MLSIKAVRFQNVFSFGNETTEVRFDSSQTTLVVGKNGGGKSSGILDTLVYGLYGKPYRKVKLGQVVNSITSRDALVEVDFEARGRSWTVRRGMKPSVFEIYRDGELVDQSDKNREQQEWFEKTVLQMDYRSFTQIVILGSANHVPFMQLPAGQRREVIEDILDIQVFSHMNDVLKERAGTVRETLQARERDLAVVQRELEVEERHLESLKRDVERERAEILQRVEEMRAQGDGLEREAEELKARALRLTNELPDVEGARRLLQKLEGVEGGLKSKLTRLQKEIGFYELHESCPTCRQEIDQDFRKEELERKRAELAEIESGMRTLAEKKSEAHGQIREAEAAQSEIAGVDREFVRKKSELTSIEGRISELLRQADGLEQEEATDQGLIDDLRRRVEETARARDETLTEARTMAHASQLLKDQGIKARILRQYVPLMNRLVNKYLAALELFVDFHLDESFNEEIRSRHRDTFSYENFSEGEKLRIDLAILFAWRDIAKMRNSSAVDLIVFDEILDGSLDAEGADYFLRLVQDLADGTHVFIISHRDGLEDKFNRVLSFQKKSNFSKLVETSA